MTLEARTARPSRRGLPLQLTSFVGRAREIAEIRALLGRTRLLTLTGPGGVGKTRLAVEVAGGLAADYSDGLWFVDLAALADPALVARTVAAAGDVAERPGMPVSITLAEVLADQRILLLLDNCEHLVESCAQLADALLRVCSGLTILATSRELFGITGEVTLLVPALTLPPEDVVPAAGAGSEAVRLFEERAIAARPQFELSDANAAAVARICRRLDGVPLAIELAAARLRVLSPDQIAERLDDRFALLTDGNRAALPRQQTLEATVSWSYDLLGEAERVLFRGLSVFAGGWTLEAAEAVCGDASASDSQVAPRHVLDTLAGLVNRSLVRADETSGGVRYGFLETIRQYAHDRLREASGEEQLARRAHALYFLALAEAVEPHLYRADAPNWMALLTSEHDNLRAALRWALDTRQTELALRLGASLYRFWRQRGHVREGRAWLAQALDARGQDGPEHQPGQLVSARALNGAGVLARGAGDFVAARPLLTESLALFEMLGADEPIANTEQNLGHVLFRLGERAIARAHLESSLERLRRLDGEAQALSASMFGCLNILGKLALDEGDLAAARAYIFEAEDCSRTVGSPHIIAHALIETGVLHLELGEHLAAAPVLHEALRVAAGAEDAWCTFQALHALACAAAEAGDARRAAVLMAAVEALEHRTGPVDISADLVLPAMRARLSQTLGSLDPITRAAAGAQGAAMTLDEVVAYGLADYEPGAPGDSRKNAAGLLSLREQEVARLMVRGYTNRQIGEALVIAVPTVERHAANIFFKLGVHSRAQVAAWATEHLPTGM
jgi:non-specific serine/threonine protein kinase